MTSLFNLLLLPLRAPMVLLLVLISTYLGLHWSRPGSLADSELEGLTTLIWSAECVQALVVVVVCTMPDLLLRRVATMMAASRVISLVVTLLLVITGGLYLLHLDVLSNVLILGSAVLLARLDLVRLRVVPPPFVMTVALSVLVLGGVSLGRSLEAHLRPWLGAPAEQASPAVESRESGHPADRPAAQAEPAPPLEPAAEPPAGARYGSADGGRPAVGKTAATRPPLTAPALPSPQPSPAPAEAHARSVVVSPGPSR
jgi:hypothetical protein